VLLKASLEFRGDAPFEKVVPLAGWCTPVLQRVETDTSCPLHGPLKYRESLRRVVSRDTHGEFTSPLDENLDEGILPIFRRNPLHLAQKRLCVVHAARGKNAFRRPLIAGL